MSAVPTETVRAQQSMSMSPALTPGPARGGRAHGRGRDTGLHSWSIKLGHYKAFSHLQLTELRARRQLNS